MGWRVRRCLPNLGHPLNRSQGGIYIDTRLANAADTVIPAFAGIQETVQNVLAWTPAYAGVTKEFTPSGCSN